MHFLPAGMLRRKRALLNDYKLFGDFIVKCMFIIQNHEIELWTIYELVLL